jgi:hypothetical protein
MLYQPNNLRRTVTLDTSWSTFPSVPLHYYASERLKNVDLRSCRFQEMLNHRLIFIGTREAKQAEGTIDRFTCTRVIWKSESYRATYMDSGCRSAAPRAARRQKVKRDQTVRSFVCPRLSRDCPGGEGMASCWGRGYLLELAVLLLVCLLLNPDRNRALCQCPCAGSMHPTGCTQDVCM